MSPHWWAVAGAALMLVGLFTYCLLAIGADADAATSEVLHDGSSMADVLAEQDHDADLISLDAHRALRPKLVDGDEITDATVRLFDLHSPDGAA